MTTLIWSDNVLYTDSRITFPTLSSGQSTCMDDFVKIREIKHFTYKDERVHAFAAAGDARIFPFFDFFIDHCAKVNQTIDIETPELYDGLKEGKIAASMMFVTDTQVVSVVMDPTWKLSITAFPKAYRLAAGSGYEKLGNMVFNAALSGIDIMTLAAMRDKTTGGPTNTWSPDVGITMNVPNPTYWQVVKKLFKSDFKNIGARLGLCAPQTI